MGNADAALDLVRDLLARASSSDAVANVVPQLERVRGHALLQTGDLRSARRALDASLTAARERSDHFESTLTMLSLIELDRLEGITPALEMVTESQSLIASLKIRAIPPVPLPANKSGNAERPRRAAPRSTKLLQLLPLPGLPNEVRFVDNLGPPEERVAGACRGPLRRNAHPRRMRSIVQVIHVRMRVMRQAEGAILRGVMRDAGVAVVRHYRQQRKQCAAVGGVDGIPGTLGQVTRIVAAEQRRHEVERRGAQVRIGNSPREPRP